MNDTSYVVITPVRNEADFVGRTIASMSGQTLLPRQWVIIDDGSTDGTGEILKDAALSRPWLTVVTRPDRGFRKSGGGVVEAFYDGYAALRDEAWDFIVKLDGDLSFNSDYFEQCLAHFSEDPHLGLGGGTVCVLDGGEPTVDSPGDPPFHVRGATKIYRRACWQQVHPLVPGPGWDTVDEVRANSRGWQTRTFPDVLLIQDRPTGAVDGTWTNSFKNGRANYITGYHPAFMLAKCLKRLWCEPRVIAAAGLWAGFCSGYLRREPHVADPDSVRYLRQQQRRYLLLQSSIYRPASSPSPVRIRR